MTKPLLVIIDNDGTAVDSEMAHFIAISRVSQTYNGSWISKDEWWEHCSGKGHARIYDWLSERAEKFIVGKDSFIRECMREYYKNLFNLQARPGMAEAMQIYNAHDIPSVILSNSPRELVIKSQNQTDLSQYVSGIFGAEDVPQPKPAPDGVLMVASRFNISSQDMNRVIMLEDSAGGCQASKDAGCMTVQLLSHPSFPHVNEPCRYTDIALLDEEELQDFARISAFNMDCPTLKQNYGINRFG